MSAFDTFLAARDSTLRNGERTQQRMDEVRRQNALRTAGQAYAGGDQAAGRNALLESGMLDEAVQMDAAQARQAQAAREMEEADVARKRATLIAAADGLLRLPADQRERAFQTRVAPYLQQNGMGDVAGMITPDVLTDGELQSFIVGMGGEVMKPETFNTRTGVVERDPYTGAYRQGYAVEPDPLDQEYRRAQIEATRAQVGQRQASASASAARAAKTRSGGSSGSGSIARPNAASAARPWERSW